MHFRSVNKYMFTVIKTLNKNQKFNGTEHNSVMHNITQAIINSSFDVATQ